MIVIDASVVIKWLKKGETESEQATLLYKKHAAGLQKILVPRLLFYEVANVLATKSKSSAASIRAGMVLLFKSRLSIYREREKDLVEIALLARKYKTSFYDMLYAVVAKKMNTSLITADEKFVEKTKFKFVKLLGSVSPEG